MCKIDLFPPIFLLKIFDYQNKKLAIPQTIFQNLLSFGVCHVPLTHLRVIGELRGQVGPGPPVTVHGA